MKRLTVSLTDAKCLELTQLASEQGVKLGRFCSTLLNTAALCLKTTQIAAQLDPDEVGDYAPLPQIAANCLTPLPQIAANCCAEVPQCVVTAPVAVARLGRWQDYAPESCSRETYLSYNDFDREMIIRADENWSSAHDGPKP